MLLMFMAQVENFHLRSYYLTEHLYDPLIHYHVLLFSMLCLYKCIFPDAEIKRIKYK
jgi:hypothetical protein